MASVPGYNRPTQQPHVSEGNNWGAKHLRVVHQARAEALDLLHGSDCAEGDLSKPLHTFTLSGILL